MITNVCYNPAFDTLDLGTDPVEFQYLTGAWPHVAFTRVTSWITAFITLERCLCITMPLKVRDWFYNIIAWVGNSRVYFGRRCGK